MPDGLSELELQAEFGPLAPFAGLQRDAARAVATAFRGECLSVRWPGIPFGEYISDAADWWGSQFVAAVGPGVEQVRRLHECVTSEIQRFVGVSFPDVCPDDDKPHWRGRGGEFTEEFLVQVPAWQDIFQFDNESVFDLDQREVRAKDYWEDLQRSPTPPSLREAAEILTMVDDLQDEAATLATALMVVEKVGGRAIPGVGVVTLAADALNVLGAVGRPLSGAGLPGRRSKRVVLEDARGQVNGYRGRLEDVRNTGALRVGWGDWLQGLQATDSLFGFGIQIGGIFGFLQDAFWLGVRGGELRARGPLWDPLGFTAAGREACYRSPRLESFHPEAYYVLANEALRLWSDAARVGPYLDVLSEPVLASTLVGMRLAEQVLGPWLRSGEWVVPLERAVEIVREVRGGQEGLELRRLPAGAWVERTAPGVTAAVVNAISGVPDRGRQAFYASLVSSIAWGLVGDLEPGSRVLGQGVAGPLRDAWLLAAHGLYPRFEVGE